MIFSRIYKISFFFVRNATHAYRTTKNEPKAYILLVVPVVTFGLGTWQIKRRYWKLNLIKELEEKTNTPAVDITENLEDIAKLEYRKVYAKGFFDHTKEIYIGPRSPVQQYNERGGGVFSKQSQSGNLVITPFKLVDSDISILVNRGWVPKSKTLTNSRQQNQDEELVELEGIVRLEEKRPVFCPKNNPNSRLFHFRDVKTMAEKCGTYPIFLDATVGSSQPGGPLGGQTRVTLRNEHLSYIITWYSLSAITLWMWYTRYRH